MALPLVLAKLSLVKLPLPPPPQLPLVTQLQAPQLPHVVLCRCLVPEYRRPLVLAELLGFNADVLCLQEVDDKMFSQLLQPQLGVAGAWGGWSAWVVEGCSAGLDG